MTTITEEMLKPFKPTAEEFEEMFRIFKPAIENVAKNLADAIDKEIIDYIVPKKGELGC